MNKANTMTLLPPHPDACPVCAMRPAHAPGDPHNAQSMYWQMAFQMAHGRAPTWKDAVAHCAPEVAAKWEAALRARGKWTEPATPPPQGE